MGKQTLGGVERERMKKQVKAVREEEVQEDEGR